MADDRRLTPQGEERKQQLLACAATLFAERGYAETRVLDIVRAAGVAKGLFYWYFPNKEEVMTELVTSTRANLRATQRAAIDRGADPLEQLRQGTEASVRFMTEHAQIYSLIRAEGVGRRSADLVSSGSDLHVRDTAQLLRAGAEAGIVRDDDPVTLAFGVIGTVAYYTHIHRSGRLELTSDELAAFVGRFVIRAVVAEGVDLARTAPAVATQAED